MKKHLLTLAAILSIGWGFTASGAVGDTFDANGLTYVVTSDSEVTVDGFTDRYNDRTAVLTIPETVSDNGVTYTVTSVGVRAFDGNYLEEVTLPNSITTIQYGGFYNNRSLKKVNFGTGLKSIGANGFAYAEFTSLTLPEGLESIGESCFFLASKMTSITFPSSLKSIGSSAFYKVPLKTVTLPENLQTLGAKAFLFCTELTEINFNASLTEIGDGTFYGCTSLQSINLPEGIRSIGDEAFWDVPLTEFKIPATLEHIGGAAFAGTKISKFTIDPANTYFMVDGNGIIYEADQSLLVAFPPKSTVTQLTLPDACLGISYGAFYGAGIQKVTVGNKFRAFDGYAFVLSSLSEINFPKSCVFIGEQAFAGTNLTSVVLPSSLPEIQMAVFAECKTLNSVTIPSSVKYIDNRAFYNCTSLVTVNCEGMTPPVLEEWYDAYEGPFFNIPSTAALNVPEGTASAYRNSLWNDCFTKINETLAASLLYTEATPQEGSSISSFEGLTLTFSEPVSIVNSDPDITVVAGNMIAGVPVGDKVSVDMWGVILNADKTKVKIFPEDYDSYLTPFNMEEGKSYFITIPAGVVKNASGSFNEEFIIEYEGAYVKPTIKLLSTDPADNAEISQIATIEFTFAEAVALQTGKLDAIKVIKGSLVDGVPTGTNVLNGTFWGVSGKTSGTNIAIFAGDEYDGYAEPVNLQTGADYYVVLPAGLFRLNSSYSTVSDEIVLHYSNPAPEIKLTAINPANNSVLEEINTIEFTFAEAVSIVSDKLEDIRVIKGSMVNGVPTGTDVLDGLFWGVYGKTSGTEVAIFAGDEYDGYAQPVSLEQGADYYVVLPAGLFSLNSSKTTVTDEIILHYSNPAPEIKLTAINPANNSQLEEINTIEFTFAEAVSIVSDKLEDIQVIKGSIVNGVPTGTDVLDGLFWGVYGKTSGTEVAIFAGDEYDGYSQPITLEPGADYYVVLPAGLFSLNSSKTTVTDEIILHYSCPAAPFGLVSSVPADGATIAQLGTVELTFAESVNINNSMLENVKLYKNGLDGEEVAVGAWWAVYDKSQGTTVAIFPGDEYDGFAEDVRFEADASYYLVLPAGIFTLSSDSSVGSEEIILGFISAVSSGVEGMEAEGNADVEIYNLQGVKVNGTVPGGIYIIRNGKNVNKVIAK